MAGLFDLAEDEPDLVDKIMDEKWKYAQTYSVGSAQTVKNKIAITFLPPEIMLWICNDNVLFYVYYFVKMSINSVLQSRALMV